MEKIIKELAKSYHRWNPDEIRSTVRDGKRLIADSVRLSEVPTTEPDPDEWDGDFPNVKGIWPTPSALPFGLRFPGGSRARLEALLAVATAERRRAVALLRHERKLPIIRDAVPCTLLADGRVTVAYGTITAEDRISEPMQDTVDARPGQTWVTVDLRYLTELLPRRGAATIQWRSPTYPTLILWAPTRHCLMPWSGRMPDPVYATASQLGTGVVQRLTPQGQEYISQLNGAWAQ